MDNQIELYDELIKIISNFLIFDMKNEPYLICFEGPDSTGKTCLIEKIFIYFKEFISEEKIKHIKFPSKDFNIKYKQLIIDDGYNKLEQNIELFKKFEDDQDNFIFNNDVIYFIDRYKLSSKVYSQLRGISEKEYNEYIDKKNIIYPNIYIILLKRYKKKIIDENDKEESFLKQFIQYNIEIKHLISKSLYSIIKISNDICILKKNN
jgi:thymidylate kinase